MGDILGLVSALAAAGNTIAVAFGLYYLNKQARDVAKNFAA